MVPNQIEALQKERKNLTCQVTLYKETAESLEVSVRTVRERAGISILLYGFTVFPCVRFTAREPSSNRFVPDRMGGRTYGNELAAWDKYRTHGNPASDGLY